MPGSPSRAGNWSYEAVDCKLARETKAETVLQLCLYSQLVAELQGLEPEFFHVIRPSTGFERESFKLEIPAIEERSDPMFGTHIREAIDIVQDWIANR